MWWGDGGYGGFFGWHALVALGAFLTWVVVVGGLFVALYFVIRTAVVKGILRADELRAVAHRRPVDARPVDTRPVDERPVSPRPDDPHRRDDGEAGRRSPDVV